MKPNRTRITDLKRTPLTELSDEQLVAASGGYTVEFGTSSDTASFHTMDVDSPSYDGGSGHSLM
jgi:hypothetical protein